MKQIGQNFKILYRGFTLVELLIVLSIFSIIVIAILETFIHILQTQTHILTTRKTVGEISYLGEYLSRQIRMAKTGENCVPAGFNYQITRGGKGLRFLTQNDQCYEVYFDPSDKTIKIQRPDGIFSLTSSDIEIENVLFEVKGNIKGDVLQPFVIIKIEARPKPKGPLLIFQTGISKRNLDVG